MAAPAVPYPGVLEPGDKHVPAAIPVKRALSRAGYLIWSKGFDAQWGARVTAACASFQKDKKVALSGAKPGTYTKATHEALRTTHRQKSTTEWAFDAYSIKLLQDLVMTPEEIAAQGLQDDATWLIVHNFLLGYSMKRPADQPPAPPWSTYFTSDCSMAVKLLYKWQSCPSPDGQPWAYGNTATLVNHGLHIDTSLSSARPGDLCFYGNPTQAGAAAHVTMLRFKRDGVWHAFSHGQASDPRDVPAKYRTIVAVRRYPLVG